MSDDEPDIIVSPVRDEGGRIVHIRGRRAGVAYSEADFLEFIRRARGEDADLVPTAAIKWSGEGPDVWTA